MDPASSIPSTADTGRPRTPATTPAGRADRRQIVIARARRAARQRQRTRILARRTG
ncbi:MAG TPA: hypothetical protein VFV89_10405 [Nocardioides sp.]|uniref:hypothetical protein n=1 Tax=Nocardioides sp. TaxID=35761 RepID=UPI002E355FE3|nr:hypothetical protein [Nocardioides sp.]HEX5088210.1 hypothetical protein [Nocardioides sp.]